MNSRIAAMLVSVTLFSANNVLGQATVDENLPAYEKTSAYGVEEFSTQSTYRIGEIYAQLSRDLLDSDRPKGLNELEREQYDILLEEQAFPFEDQAIDVFQTNAKRTNDGIWDEWVQKSFNALANLQPGRYAKNEKHEGLIDAIY